MNSIVIPKKGNTTSIYIMARVGSRHENANVKGISHFIEHLMFKGTDTRNAKDISLGIEKYGGDLNAFTSEEVTAYKATVATRYAEPVEEILLDMVLNSKFDQKEIDKERHVVLQEIKMYDDDPNTVAYMTLIRNVFKNHPIRNDILGTEASIKEITVDILNKVPIPMKIAARYSDLLDLYLKYL